jgi:ankyrin repeat protein
VLLDVVDMRTHLTGELYSGNWGKMDAETGELEMLDIEHMTLLHLALERLDPKEDEVDDPEPLPDAVRAEAEELIRMLVERGADINARDQHGRTPLHQAVGAGLHTLAELLCSWGADASVVGCKAIGMGNTMLHQAALRGDGEMIRLLVRAAPHLDVNASGQGGLTALCLAARANKEQAAKALLEGGASPTAVCAFGKSALDMARLNQRAAILKLFGEP